MILELSKLIEEYQTLQPGSPQTNTNQTNTLSHSIPSHEQRSRVSSFVGMENKREEEVDQEEEEEDSVSDRFVPAWAKNRTRPKSLYDEDF
jgi:hypothetical protein